MVSSGAGGWNTIAYGASVIQGHTVAGQGLQQKWTWYGGRWLEMIITGEPPEWAAVVIMTSSGEDAMVELPLGGSDREARVAVEKIMAGL